MASINKKIDMVIDGAFRQVVGIERVEDGRLVDFYPSEMVVDGILREIADLIIYYTWKKYNVVETIHGYELWVPSIDETLSTIKDMDYDDIDFEYGSCDEEWEDDELQKPYVAYYKDIYIDDAGNIQGSTSGTYETGSYVSYGVGADKTWYWIAEKYIESVYMGYVTGHMKLYKIEPKKDATYSQGDYIEDVTSTNPDEFPNPPYHESTDHIHTDGYWYEKQ